MRLHPRKRTLLIPRMLLLLTGGAIINVAVAWGLARFSPTTRSDFPQGAKCRVYFNGWPILDTPSKLVDLGEIKEGFGVCVVDASVQIVAPGARPTAWRLMLDAGWPILAMRAEWRSYVTDDADQYSKTSLHHGWLTSSKPREDLSDALTTYNMPAAFVCPTSPLWPGFAINTVFYAAILWLLVAAPGWARRRIRARRGQCVACGYRIAPGTGDVCSECGKPVTPRPRMGATECSHG